MHTQLKKIFINKYSIYIVAFLMISLALWNSLLLEKHLSADGVHYFVSILSNKNFFITGLSRQFSNFSSQWALVLAVKLGIKSFSF